MGTLPPDPPGRRVGLFGGTFNPIHNGHLASAVSVRTQAQLDTVLMLPTRIPPHKGSWDLPAPSHRLAMLERAMTGHAGLSICTLELERPGPSYTVDTLRVVREAWGERAEIFFILGMDAFLDMPQWYKPLEILALANIIVTTRPGSPSVAPEAVFEGKGRFVYTEGRYSTSGERYLIYMIIPDVPVSATEIRRRVHAGESIDGLVDPAVAAYIREHELYR